MTSKKSQQPATTTLSVKAATKRAPAKKGTKRATVNKVEKDESVHAKGNEGIEKVPNTSNSAAGHRLSDEGTELVDEGKVAIDEAKPLTDEAAGALEKDPLPTDEVAVVTNTPAGPGIITRVKSWVASQWAKDKGWIIGLSVLLVALVVFFWIQDAKIQKLKKQAQRDEQKVTNSKGELSVTEANLQEMQKHRRIDSSINENLKAAAYLMQDHMRYDERAAEEIEILKRENHDMQVRLNTNDPDSLRLAGESAAKRH